MTCLCRRSRINLSAFPQNRKLEILEGRQQGDIREWKRPLKNKKKIKKNIWDRFFGFIVLQSPWSCCWISSGPCPLFCRKACDFLKPEVYLGFYAGNLITVKVTHSNGSRKHLCSQATGWQNTLWMCKVC